MAVDFDVEGGEFFGFFWKDYGVVSFNWTDRIEGDDTINQNYCGANTDVGAPGETVELQLWPSDYKDSPSHRDYAVSFHFCSKFIFIFLIVHLTKGILGPQKQCTEV